MKAKKVFSLLSIVGAMILCGCSTSNTPYIGDNGNWWIGDSDLGVPAKGDKGDTGEKGETGTKGDAGKDGEDGKDGKSIVSIKKTSSNGNVDIYTITYSDGSTSTFEIVNGKDGEKGEPGGKGENGKDGANPYIGDNGHWFIDGKDTGIIAGASEIDERAQSLNTLLCSSGLTYKLMTINGISGYVVDGFDSSVMKETALNYYHEFSDVMSQEQYTKYVENLQTSLSIIIPNNIGTIPVIGVGSEAFYRNTNLSYISLSKNTIYLGDSAFRETSSLKSFDFNDCHLTYIPDYAFYESSLPSITLPETVTTLYSHAFYDCTALSNFNYSNITYFGSYSLYDIADEYIWLSKKVKYVGERAFSNAFVFIEEGAETSIWYELNGITYNNNYYSATPVENCHKNEDFIYKYEEDGTIAAYRYLHEEMIATIPGQINGVNITRLGTGFLNNYKRVTSSSISTKVLDPYKEVIIPNSVNTIDYGALEVYGALVYIPSSVNRMFYGSCLFDNEKYYCTFIAFESSTFPTLFDEENNETKTTGDELLMDAISEGIRWALSIDLEKVDYDSNTQTFYLDNGTSYSVLACEALNTETIEVLSTYNGKPVQTIMTSSYADLPSLKHVKIGENITRIQKYAFYGLSLSYAIIPSSVAVIGKYGFNKCCDNYLIGASTIPDDWDTYWAGTTSPSVSYSIDTDNLIIDSIIKLIYSYNGIEITLIKNLDTSSSSIILPSTIYGVPVTSISAGFVTSGSYKSYYIPLSIVNAEEGAFGSRSINYFYFEASTLPSGFDESWSSYNYTSSYTYYNQTMPNA